MQALATVTTVFAFVAIAIHVYIWIIESFLWTKPKGRETFGMTEEFAESTKEMAANQGLYNLMLAWIAATGLLAFWFGSPQVGVALMFAGLGSMAIAGAYLFLTSPDKRKPALIQLTPPLLSLIFLFVMIYFFAGMPLYDSFIIAMGTAGTGGFTVFNDGIAHYHSTLITYLVSFGVLVFGVNFNLYYYIMLRKFKAFFGDEELRTYLMIVGVSSLLIACNIFHLYHNFADSFEMSFFQVSNVITTTGFGFGNTVDWPLFSQFLLLMLMVVGGSAGSTAGGLKVIRCLILARIGKNQIRSTLSPNRVMTLHVNGTALDKDTQHKILKYFVVYTLITIALIAVVSFDSNNFMTVVSAVFSCFNNIGPMIGTTDTFAIFSPISKFLLSIAMIAGRLEIYPMLLLFMPRTWSDR